MTVDETRLRAVLGSFAAGREALEAGPAIQALHGGLDNHVFRVSSARGHWVVRLAGARDARFQINRVAERQTHAAAAARGFAPALVHADTDAGVLVSDYVPGEPWSRARARSPEGIVALGRRLGALHGSPPPRAVRRLDIHDTLLHYLGMRDVPEGPMPREELAARVRWSLATYRPAPSVLCHNDLHHLNLLGEQPMFVDWEYGGVGDPLFELAAVVGYHDYDAEQRMQLLEAHGGGYAPAHLARMCLVFDCLHALWLDAAGGWASLEAERRDALLERLAVDPADRKR